MAWWLPQLAGDWYDQNLQIYNALISAFLIFAILRIQRTGWTLDLATICALQILFNLGDLIVDSHADHYNAILTVFNAIEIGIILLLGGPREIYRTLYGKHCRSGADPPDFAGKVADRIQARKHNA